jgi:hypothetical protein
MGQHDDEEQHSDNKQQSYYHHFCSLRCRAFRFASRSAKASLNSTFSCASRTSRAAAASWLMLNTDHANQTKLTE